MSTATASMPPAPAAAFRRKPVGLAGSTPQIIQPAGAPSHPGVQLPVRGASSTATSHSRTASSASAHQSINPVSYQAYLAQSRRSPSMATVSTLPSSVPTRKNSSSNNSLERSASSRSGGPSSSSYVAMMRRQKATVWSDRAQHEDPRTLAAQRAAKLRAHMEVSGAASSRGNASIQSSSLTGGVARKIRHGHAVKAQQYNPDPTTGVPVRLSAREVDESDSDDDARLSRSLHQRSGSGRSSVNSGGGRAQSLYGLTPRPPPDANAAATTPSVELRARADTRGSLWSEGAEPTPVPGKHMGTDYFAQPPTHQPGSTTAGSDDQEASFGAVGALPAGAPKDPAQAKLDLAELRRRGSVDERTMTMSGYGRLFVANPDLSD